MSVSSRRRSLGNRSGFLGGFDTIKTVVAEVSRADWRLRWPLLLLPLLLLALLISLLQINQKSAEQSNTQQEWFQGLSATAVSGADGLSNGASDPQTAFRVQMIELDSVAAQLLQWLQQGRGMEASAETASVLSSLSETYVAGRSVLPDVSFWNRYSDTLALLEQDVINGVIATPESKQAVAELRERYAELRASLINTPSLGVPVDSAVDDSNDGGNSSASNAAGSQSELASVLDRVRDQRAEMVKLNNRALILSALSAGLFALLMWGLWRRYRQQQVERSNRYQSDQTAILRLLDEITPLAQGDLRVRATVSEASTGAIADAFNYAVAELRRLVNAVTQSADLVNASVDETRESAQQLAKASSVQAREIHRSSNYLNVMSDTMAQLSAHAVESSGIADRSVRKAQQGKAAVNASVDNLNRIREQASMTSRLMQRLVETTEAINERVDAIQSVAKRTDLLALNATISSASNLAQGSGNVVTLTNEVSHLADTLSQSSRDITQLCELIQQDATITLDSMAKTRGEIEEGQRTAKLASDNLSEIDSISRELNRLISDIASKSLRQAGVVKQLSANMGVINNITRDSTLQLQQSATALSTLQTMTGELRDSVSDFKLPHTGANRASRVKRGSVEQPSTKRIDHA